MQTFLVIIHSIGAVLGVGAVTFAEIFYLKFKTFLGGQLHPTNNSFFKIIFAVERVGLTLLVFSGLGLLLMDGEALRTDPKLWAKLAIMLVLLFDTVLWKSQRVSGLLWGAVSIASWYTTLILGLLHGLDASFALVMFWYLGVILIIAVILNFVRNALGIRNTAK